MSGVVADRRSIGSKADGRAIAGLYWTGISPIDIGQHCVVNVSTQCIQCIFYRVQIGLVPVFSELSTVGQPAGYVLHELCGIATGLLR